MRRQKQKACQQKVDSPGKPLCEAALYRQCRFLISRSDWRVITRIFSQSGNGQGIVAGLPFHSLATCMQGNPTAMCFCRQPDVSAFFKMSRFLFL